MPSDLALELITTSAEWDAYQNAHDAHILQTFAWGELKSQFGWRAERVALRSREKIHTTAQILYRPLVPGLTLAYIPRGPVTDDAAQLLHFLEHLEKHLRARRVFALKLEPDWLRDDARDTILAYVRAARTNETIQPPATIHLDLTPNLDTILARMKSKWRYNIRLAEKKEVRVRAGTSADLPAFYELMKLTGERDRFAIHGLEYYRAAFELFDAQNQVRLFIAEFENQPLAMIFVTAFAQEAIYLYGASGNAERNRMPNHALHWAAIQWAKARGCARYDLWGIPENVQKSEETLPLPDSLYQFKQGFGGEIVRYSGAWDIVFDSLRYRLYQLARQLRKSSIG